jgi:hypothetical protein
MVDSLIVETQGDLGMSYNHKLSKEFLDDLVNPCGLLRPLLERIKEDHTLMLAIRNNWINIYYRGGSALKVEVCKRHGSGYTATFDDNFNRGFAPSQIEFPFHVLDRDCRQTRFSYF